MNISYNWLCEYIKTDLSVDEIGVILTDIGLEVEGIEKKEAVKGGLNGVVVGEVLECGKHPNADSLSLTKVDIGTDEAVQIVCGAPNVAKGQKVAVATIGTVLYSGDESFKIKKGKIRGELSMGMICAEDELGLGSNHDGIMVLDTTVENGTSFRTILDLKDDFIIEIGLTPNRSDAMSHWGVARDLAAGIEWREGNIEYSPVKWRKAEFAADPMNIKVEVDQPEKAPRYTGLEIRNVKVGPSPDWLKERLLAIGLSPINNVVDVTNYVLHGVGQPLHAFDADKIAGGVVKVKTLEEGSTFVTLDDVERKLSSEDLMICDANGGMCIAGVFGGKESGVSENTVNIFLESAYFEPVTTRKSAKRHALNTDASFRFERGIDPNITVLALEHVASLIVEVAGGSIHGPTVDIGIKNTAPFTFDVRPKRMNTLIGQEIAEKDLAKILSDLEIEYAAKGEDWTVKVPAYRTDVQREADLIEDVLRIYGYNKVLEPARMQISLSYSDVPEPHQLQERVSEILSAKGFHEAMSNSLISAEWNSWVVEDESKRVAMLNPLSSDMAEMRTSLIPEMLASAQRNVNHQRPDVKFYEFGTVYQKDDLNFLEHAQLILMSNGKEMAENWQGRKDEVDVYWMRGICEMIMSRLGLLDDVKLEKGNHPLLGDVVSYSLGNESLLHIGETPAHLAKKAGIKIRPIIAEWNWEKLVTAVRTKKPAFKEIARFPEMRRDFALLVDESVSFIDLKNCAYEAIKGGMLKNVKLFDVYVGDKLPKGKKSYAISFTFQDPKKTMTDKQVDKFMNRIHQSLDQAFGVELR